MKFIKNRRRSLASVIAGFGLAVAQGVAAQSPACEYVVSNEWGDGASATIRINNNGSSPINGWSLSWSYDNNSVSSSWNANVEGSNPYTASNVSWNGSIAPGDSAEFGLQISTNGGGAETPTLSGDVCDDNSPGGASSAAPSPASSAAASSVGSGGSGSQQCDWYGSLYPLCDNQTSGWGWEDNQSCIGSSTCTSQNGSGGIVGGGESSTPASSSSSSVPPASSAAPVSSSAPNSSSAPSSSSEPGASSSSSSTPGNGADRGNPTGNSLLKISEVVPKSDRPDFYDDRDWVELVNTGSSTINLSDYSLGDDKNPLESLPDITIQPGEYVIVLAGGDALTDGTPYVSFGLGREDSVSLFQGNEEVDYISWVKDQSKNGRSYGRVDNEAKILYPTPGYDNVEYVLFADEEIFRVDIEIDQSTWQAILANPQAEQYYPATMDFNGGRIENVGFRTKGQASLNFVSNTTRYGFKIDMNEYEEQKFMGMKKLVLNNSFSDPTMMRDVLAYKLMRDAGVPAPRTSYVELWVAGEHIGLYQLVEMIDSEFIELHFPEDDDNDDKGDLYKGELMQTLEWQGNNISSYSEGLRLKLNEETIGTPQEGDALLRFLDSINNGPDRLAHVDNDLMVKYLAALVLTGNMDSYIGGTANNFYLYEERSRDQFTMLPWDFNLAFGMWGDGLNGLGGGWGGGWGGGGQTCDVVDHVIDNPVSDTTSRPLVDAILENEQLRQQYHQELQSLLDGPYNPSQVEQEINRIANLIDPYVQDDPTKFFTYDEWRTSLTQDMPANSDNSGARGANTYGPAPGLLKFITQRANNVQRQLNGEIPSGNNGGSACPPN